MIRVGSAERKSPSLIRYMDSRILEASYAFDQPRRTPSSLPPPVAVSVEDSRAASKLGEAEAGIGALVTSIISASCDCGTPRVRTRCPVC